MSDEASHSTKPDRAQLDPAPKEGSGRPVLEKPPIIGITGTGITGTQAPTHNSPIQDYPTDRYRLVSPYTRL